MAMIISHLVVPHRNPAKKNEPARYYAQAQASNELDFEESCEAIASRSICTETGVRAAISGILYEMKRTLKAGRIARLDDLGSLQMGLSGEGATSVKGFSGSMAEGTHLIFHPGKTLAGLMKILSYRRAPTRAMVQAGTGDDGEEDPDKDLDSGGYSSDGKGVPDPMI